MTTLQDPVAEPEEEEEEAPHWDTWAVKKELKEEINVPRPSFVCACKAPGGDHRF